MAPLRKKIERIAHAHNAAMESMTQDQLDALDRIIVATLIIATTANNLVDPAKADIPTIRQDAINGVLEQEAKGKKFVCPWWFSYEITH